MAINRVMGSETEYGIVGKANDVLENYKGKTSKHENASATNKSAVAGMADKGHFGGDYVGQEMDVQLAGEIGLVARPRAAWSYGELGDDYGGDEYYGSYAGGWQGSFSHYFGRDDMLVNGARFYIDMGHPEYSTPECSNPVAAVIADKAGERVLEIASGAGKVARIFKNNTDGFNSYGAHENYLVDRKHGKHFQELARLTIPFFVSRIVYTGSGRIGFRDNDHLQIKKAMSNIIVDYASLKSQAGDDLMENYLRVKKDLEELIGHMQEDEFIFHISQRADFFSKLIGLQTTYDRPIINTRDEALSDSSRYMRFHVINGDANLSEIAMYMKFGTTALILDLFEDEILEQILLADPVEAFHSFSRDPSLKARAKVKAQGEMTAVDIQRFYLEAAESAYRGRDDMTDDILNRWKYILDALEDDPMQLNRWLDWVIKKSLIDSYMAKTDKPLHDADVRNVDLQYHEINRQNGFFYKLQSKGLVDRLVSDEQIEHAVDNPPEDTRAWLRGQLMKKYNISTADWNKVSIAGETSDIVMKDPLKGTIDEMGDLFDGQGLEAGELMKRLDERGYVEKRTYAYSTNIGGNTNARTKTTTISKVRTTKVRKKGRSWWRWP